MFWTNVASAQDAKSKVLKGIVSDSNNETLPGAIILTLPEMEAGSTDTAGRFEIPILPTTVSLVVSFTGFQSDTFLISSINSSQLFEVKLFNLIDLDEVTIQSRLKTTEIGMLDAMKVEKIGIDELMKAACCNLSESFETTPSVDVGFTDAVSGYKQIQMLGLAGSHTMFTRENIPDSRGLAAITGLTFTPGAWVESMQLSKGTGSVVNGYEGTAGQINVEWKKPFEEKEPRLHLNGYQSYQGRSEANAIWNKKLSEGLSTNLLLHGRADWLRVDMNKDGFMDQPLGKTFVGANRWFFFHPKGIEVQAGIKGVYLDNTGGQVDYEAGTQPVLGKPWGYEQELKRMEAWAKIGKIYPHKRWRSMGLQLSGVLHRQDNRYGDRVYNAEQNSFYANYIYQSIISNSNHVIKAGASVQIDDFKEKFVANIYRRQELIPGIFTEYAFTHLTKFSLVAGVRADYHNLFGAFVTPRLHLRYAPNEQNAIRASAGRAQRTANVFAENMAYMASVRQYVLPVDAHEKAFGLNPEVAWNMGLNWTNKFMFNYRDGAFSIDYYYTHFTNQVVIDIEQYNQVRFYNLDGQSFAHSFQAQLDYEPIRKLDVRLAYRWYNVQTTYGGLLKEKPLIAAHRAFANIAYALKGGWKFDYTVQWIGSKRLPVSMPLPNQIEAGKRSPSFVQMNAQVSKSWENFEIYVGGENMTGIMQPNLIQGAENPFGNNFDATLVWGPSMGRNFYIGFRYNLR